MTSNMAKSEWIESIRFDIFHLKPPKINETLALDKRTVIRVNNEECEINGWLANWILSQSE